MSLFALFLDLNQLLTVYFCAKQPCADDSSADHDIEESYEVEAHANTNEVQHSVAEFVAGDRVFDIIGEEELQPKADQYDGFVKNLNNVIYDTDHWLHVDVEREKESA